MANEITAHRAASIEAGALSTIRAATEAVRDWELGVDPDPVGDTAEAALVAFKALMESSDIEIRMDDDIGRPAHLSSMRLELVCSQEPMKVDAT